MIKHSTPKRAVLRVLAFAAVAVCLAGAPDRALATPFTLSIIPVGGAISGTPGSTTGWGYTLTNTSLTDWLMLTNLSADVFQHAVPNASVFDFPILAPGATVTVPWIAGIAGLYEITWDLTAPIGLTESGTFIVSGEWWSGDPFGAGQFLQFATDQAASYSATVTAPASVPEPSTLLLLTGALAVCWRRMRATRVLN
jgi:hypothetical protein